jgi:membrane peptidoglycan carboxypeptidase
MIPLWFRLLTGLWLLVVASISCIVALLLIRATFRLFVRYCVPLIHIAIVVSIRTADIACAWIVARYRPIIFAGASSFVILAALLCQWYFFWDTTDVPDVMEMVRYSPAQIGYVYDSRNNVMVELANVFRKPLQYSELTLPIEQATIAAEDKDFYEHDGIPVLCASVPFKQSQLCLPIPLELGWRWLSGKGGSTLTMQLVRNHYLREMVALERSDTLVVNTSVTRWLASWKGAGWVNRRIRKMREIKYALHLERALRTYAQRHINEEMRERGFWWPQRWYQSRVSAKRRAKEILIARYLSTVYYGYSMYGPDSAARFYFNKTVRELSVSEAALLASFEPAPSVYGQITRLPNVRREQATRRNAVLRRMGNKGFIYSAFDCGRPENLWDSLRWFLKAELPRGDCRDEVAYFSAQPVVLMGRIPGGRSEAPAAVQTALEEVAARGFPNRTLFDGMIRLHTTNDLRIQKIVNRAAQEGLAIYRNHYSSDSGRPQIAIAVLRNSDAAILAQFGGFVSEGPNSWTHLDRSRKSWRQSGSIFKVFVYLAALSEGEYSPDTMVNDGAPFPVRMGGGWTHYVQNYTGDYRGWIPFREAVAQSRNVPAMHVGIEYTTIDAIIRTAREAGITSPLRHESSIILGASDITVIELANAFRTIASGGIVARPHTLERVTNSFGETLDSYRASTRHMQVPPRALAAMQELLRGAVRLPSGTARSIEAQLPDVPVLCKTGTSNRFADARVACSTYGPTGITVSVWMGFDESTRSLGDGASGGRLALPVARYIFERLYRDDGAHGAKALLGDPPKFPEAMEASIDSYIERTYRPANQK